MSQKHIPRTVLASLVLLLLSSPAGAEAAARQPRTFAVLVGISKYADAQIRPRPHGEADAQALYDLFTSKDYLGANPQHVKLLLGSGEARRGSQPATRENILQALRSVAANAGADDLVLFAFIGNGGSLGELGDRRCYFAADSTFKSRARNAVAAAEIGEALKDLKTQRFAAFVDVDFKGFDAPVWVSDPFPAVPLDRLFLGGDRQPWGEEDSPLPGRAVFLATDGVTVPVDLERHGLFTVTLLEGLKGAADQTGGEPDGFVTVPELIEHLVRRRPQRINEEGDADTTPRLLYAGDPAATFVLSRNPEVMPRVRTRLARLETLVRDGSVPARYAAEAKAFLERMPAGQVQRALRKEYQTLVDGAITLQTFEQRRTAILEKTRLSEVESVSFAKRVIEATQLVQESYIKELNQGELAAWGIMGLYQQLDERIPEEIEGKLRKAKTLPEEELRTLLAQARRKLGKREELDGHKDLDITLRRMLPRLDPYSGYIDPEKVERFNCEPAGRPVGIGLQLHKEHRSGMLLAAVRYRKSPAYDMGLRTGDLITRIARDTDADGQLIPPQEFFARHLSTAEALKILLGKNETKVKLTIERPGESKPREILATRGRIEIETVLGHQRDAGDDWDYFLDRDSKIAYIRLTQLSRNTAQDLRRVLQNLTRQGMKGLVLDLRFNPGGLYDSAIKISDLFIGDGLITTIRPRAGLAQGPVRFHGHKEGSLLDFPIACLVNGESASASEVLAAALQDHNRAWIIGERSHGKASVQNIQAFEGGGIKLTTAVFLSPRGRNLNKLTTTGLDTEEWGVRPDLEVRLARQERDELADALRNGELLRPWNNQARSEFKDRQLSEALVYLRRQVKLGAGVVPGQLAQKELAFENLRP